MLQFELHYSIIEFMLVRYIIDIKSVWNAIWKYLLYDDSILEIALEADKQLDL